MLEAADVRDELCFLRLIGRDLIWQDRKHVPMVINFGAQTVKDVLRPKAPNQVDHVLSRWV